MRRGCLILIVLLLAAGCSDRTSRIVVGSKNFTEQVLLAELLAQEIEAKLGLRAERRVNLGGTLICHEAVVAGQIDLYVEYTGTALTAILHLEPSGSAAEVLARVRQEYRRRFGLEVLDPLGFDNTFAMVVRGEDARRLGLRTISDAVPYARTWRAGFGYEFMERPDGYRGLAETYGLEFGAPPRVMDLGLLYRALLEKQVDIVAGNSTDGVMAALDLVVLEDDRHYFPPYEAVPVVNRAALERHPELRRVLAEFAGKISADEMRRMNYAVDGEQRDAADVVREFRHRKGF